MKRRKAEEEIPEVDDYVEPEVPVEEDGSALDTVFPSEHVEPLRGLLFLGKLENEVIFAGHSFLIKTLTEGELLRIGQLCKSYMGTMSELESRRLYVVSAAIESVDGQPLVTQYKDGIDQIYAKAQEVKKWYPAVIIYLFNEYIALEQTAIQVTNSLKK